jgi:protein SCO1/2
VFATDLTVSGPQLRFLLMLAFACAVIGGCQSSRKTYPVKGQILARNDSAGQITLDNEDIPGFMPAMTMIFPVKDAHGLQQIQPGDKISAVVVVEKGGSSYWLEHITTTDRSGRRLFSAPKRSRELLPNQKLPDVPLINQDGKTLHFADFRGQAVLLTFIYTRCPFPDFCPLISSRFAQIHNTLAQTPSVYKNTHLVSVSLDPGYDTPPVLRKYGIPYLRGDTSGFAHWDFVSTGPGDLRKLASAFGLQYFEQNNQITHSLSTILLAPDGTVKQIWPGSEWKTSEAVAALKDAAVQEQNARVGATKRQ